MSERQVASGTHADRRALVAWRNAVFVIFGLNGLAIATWLSRNPAIRDLLHASTAQMGWVVFGLAAGSILGLGLSSQMIAAIGPRRTIVLSGLLLSMALAAAGSLATLTGSMVAVMLALAVYGLGVGTCDVAMNVDGAAVERELGRTVMPLFHAAFSFGTMAGAGLGALAERLAVPVAVHTGVIAVVVAAGILLAVRRLQPHPVIGDDTGALAAGWRARLAVWREPKTVLIGLIVLGMAFAEGSANDWLPLAMVDGHGVSNATGAFVLGLFLTAMTAARIGGVLLLDKFGRVPVLRASAALAVAGLLTVILVSDPVIAGIGVVLWGMGSALGFPVGMSAAADDPKVAAVRVSAVAMIGYFAFLVGPPVIGFLGEHFGLLRALLLVMVVVAVAGLVSGAAREQRPKSRPGPEPESA